MDNSYIGACDCSNFSLFTACHVCVLGSATDMFRSLYECKPGTLCLQRMSTQFRITRQAFRVCLQDLESSFRCTLPQQRDIYRIRHISKLHNYVVVNSAVCTCIYVHTRTPFHCSGLQLLHKSSFMHYTLQKQPSYAHCAT